MLRATIILWVVTARRLYGGIAPQEDGLRFGGNCRCFYPPPAGANKKSHTITDAGESELFSLEEMDLLRSTHADEQRFEVFDLFLVGVPAFGDLTYLVWRQHHVAILLDGLRFTAAQ